MGIKLWLVASILAASFTTVAAAQEIDWKKVDDTFGRKPAVSGDVHRYGFPRTDLTVTLDGVTIKPALALGGWVAFKPMHGEAMIMGDLVLLETEINPVMLKMIEGGLEITAVHNHLLRASPATFYMHVGGHGDPTKMATVIRDALAVSKTPLATPAAAPLPTVELDTAQLDQIIGVKGQANGGVYQFAVSRRDPVTRLQNQPRLERDVVDECPVLAAQVLHRPIVAVGLEGEMLPGETSVLREAQIR